MFDKEFEKLKQLEEELTAMQHLNADEAIIKAQKQKIAKQENKIKELIGKYEKI